MYVDSYCDPGTIPDGFRMIMSGVKTSILVNDNEECIIVDHFDGTYCHVDPTQAPGQIVMNNETETMID